MGPHHGVPMLVRDNMGPHSNFPFSEQQLGQVPYHQFGVLVLENVMWSLGNMWYFEFASCGLRAGLFFELSELWVQGLGLHQSVTGCLYFKI